MSTLNGILFHFYCKLTISTTIQPYLKYLINVNTFIKLSKGRAEICLLSAAFFCPNQPVYLSQRLKQVFLITRCKLHIGLSSVQVFDLFFKTTQLVSNTSDA